MYLLKMKHILLGTILFGKKSIIHIFKYVYEVRHSAKTGINIHEIIFTTEAEEGKYTRT